MRFSSFLAVALAVVPSLCTPVERRATTFPITGATGGVYPRLEIRQLHGNPDAWNLFLCAMYNFMSTNQSTMLSYYQVAGIHGVPNIPWDGVQANPNSGGAVGYCPHSSVLFPTWHRAYMALFEQVFLQQVQAVVNSWPAGSTRDKYASIAKTMRFPYFDWAAAPPSGLPAFPLILSAMQVSITTPSGTYTITNPLYRYDFHPLSSSDMIYNPWGLWSRTMRYPSSNTSASAYSNENLVTDAFTNNRINIRNQLYSVFTQCTEYAEFSNDASADSTPGCSSSVEGVHDTIHSMLGGNNYGHMTYLWYAAFDPVFFMHHMNVDRIFAMWQTLYPSQYVTNQVATGSTFTIAQGTTQGVNSPLTPFHSDASGTFWTSTNLRDWTKLGYTYPEFVDSSGSASAIASYVNKLYGPSATATAGSSKRTAMPEPVMPEPATPVEVREAPPNVPLPTAAINLLSTPNGERYEYTANIAAYRFGLDSSFSVYIFLGEEIDENPTSWAFDYLMVGSHGFFAMSHMRKHNISVSGAVPLTTALTGFVESGALADMSPVNVVPFLRQNLKWRIATTNGEAVPAAQVPGLEVSVVTANATVPVADDQFPKWSKWVELPGVTDGQPGGLTVGKATARQHAKRDRLFRFGQPQEEEI